jgi:uncharacterized coiled-coil protein SlyX
LSSPGVPGRRGRGSARQIIDQLRGSLARRDAKVAHQRDQIRGYEGKLRELGERLNTVNTHNQRLVAYVAAWGPLADRVAELRRQLQRTQARLDTSLMVYAREATFDQRVDLMVIDLDEPAATLRVRGAAGRLAPARGRWPQSRSRCSPPITASA